MQAAKAAYRSPIIGVTSSSALSAFRNSNALLTTVLFAYLPCQDAKRTLNTQNRDGETPLGWVLKCAAGGDLLDARTASRLTDKLLEAGALAVLPSFAEKVSAVGTGRHHAQRRGQQLLRVHSSAAEQHRP